MGSLSLKCPLCCDESFTNQKSLRYHLLSIMDNLFCPVCGKRFETMLELAEHLDKECVEGEKDAVVKKEVEDNNASSNSFPSNSILAKALTQPRKAKNPAVCNVEVSAEPPEQGKQLANETDENSNEETPMEFEEHEFYTCSSCNISFISVVDHLQTYHGGQEVVLEINEPLSENSASALMSLPAGATVLASNDDVAELPEMEDELDSNDGTVPTRLRAPQILNTIKQEECVDKDGRVYTRKVVQIEKFWDKEKNKRHAISQKYVMDQEGELEKLENVNEPVDAGRVIEVFRCSNCIVQFSKMDQFISHVCEPEISSDYKCSQCSMSFSSSKSLCNHMKVHRKKEGTDATTPSDNYLCTTCDTVFPTNKSLRLHRRMHEPVKAKQAEAPVEYNLTGNVDSSKPREKFKCQFCGKSYDMEYRDIHLSYHSGDNNYDCGICNRKFYTQSNLEMHMRVHAEDKGYACAYCKKEFEDTDAWSEHVKQHCSSRPYQCQYCGRRFTRPHEKVKHERIHTGEKPHECEICGKTFRVSYCLTLHMRTHSGFRPYVCQHCGKRFKAHSVYNHHLLTHSDVRAYKCPYCPKAFKTGVQLAGHKNSHTKPFSCTECNRPFASLYAVRAHMETHKRENNLKFSCEICGASYARAFALNDHIKEQHSEDSKLNGNVSYFVSQECAEAATAILPDDTELALVELEHIAVETSEEGQETADV